MLTDDTICGATALEVGLPTLLLPEHWLRDPEPDDGARENAKLQAEIRRLAATEPKVVLGFRDAVGQSLERLDVSIARWPTLIGDEIDELMEEVQKRCPPASSFERPAPRATDQLFNLASSGVFGTRSVYQPATDQEIDLYRTSAYPEWLASVRKSLNSVHDKLTARTEWPSVRAIASNTGTRPASEVLMCIRAQGSFAIFDDEVSSKGREEAPEGFSLELPPAPPRGKTRVVDALGVYRNLGGDIHGAAYSLPTIPPHLTPLPPKRSDTFYWREGQHDWTQFMELECSSWRHGQQEISFLLKIKPNQRTDFTGAIELSVHANNIADPLRSRLPIRISFVDGATANEARVLVNQLGHAARAQGRL